MRQAHVARDARFRFLLFSCCRPLKPWQPFQSFPTREKHLPSPIPSNTISLSLSFPAPSFSFIFFSSPSLSSLSFHSLLSFRSPASPTSFSQLLLRLAFFHFLEIESEKRELVLIKSSNVAQGNELTSPHFSTDLPSLNGVYIYKACFLIKNTVRSITTPVSTPVSAWITKPGYSKLIARSGLLFNAANKRFKRCLSIPWSIITFERLEGISAHCF